MSSPTPAREIRGVLQTHLGLRFFLGRSDSHEHSFGNETRLGSKDLEWLCPASPYYFQGLWRLANGRHVFFGHNFLHGFALSCRNWRHGLRHCRGRRGLRRGRLGLHLRKLRDRRLLSRGTPRFSWGLGRRERFFGRNPERRKLCRELEFNAPEAGNLAPRHDSYQTVQSVHVRVPHRDFVSERSSRIISLHFSARRADTVRPRRAPISRHASVR